MFGDRDKLIDDFIEIAPSIFDEVMFEMKFRRFHRDESNIGASIVYLYGEIYVCLTVGIHYHDGPEHCNISLGEGSTDSPEADWNSIDLWQHHQRKDEKEDFDYVIRDYKSIHEVLVAMREDLLMYAADFLRGDLKVFHRIRAVQNSSREPYKIYKPASFGLGYKVSYDAESVRLKEKFSKE